MKIRNGFVSNSSSSSFIVAFDQDPNDPEYLKKILYNDEDRIPHEFDWLDEDGEGCDTDELVCAILNELRDNNRKIKTIKQMSRVLASGYMRHPDMPELDIPHHLRGEEMRAEMDRQLKEIDKAAYKIAKKFMQEHKGAQIYHMTFSDDTSLGTQLEHGGTFDGISHLRISHH